MPRLIALLALCAAVCAAAALPRTSHDDAEARQLLRDSLHNLRRLRAAGRGLKGGESAYSAAVGGTSASASASAGGGRASTQQSATGPGAQVQGISQVGQKVDTCQRGPANSAACETLTTADRSSLCSDIAPDAQFTCEEQVKFGKCGSEFMWRDAYCLKSCGRCGDGCVDVAPPGGACALDQCNSTAVTAPADGTPYCLKTCGRCSAAA